MVIGTCLAASINWGSVLWCPQNKSPAIWWSLLGPLSLFSIRDLFSEPGCEKNLLRTPHMKGIHLPWTAWEAARRSDQPRLFSMTVHNLYPRSYTGNTTRTPNTRSFLRRLHYLHDLSHKVWRGLKTWAVIREHLSHSHSQNF